MIYNNLNRIKGILSARQGAQIPKFTPGGLLYKQLKNGKYVYSNDNGKTWYDDAQFTQQYDGRLNSKFWQTKNQYFNARDLDIDANATLGYVAYAKKVQQELQEQRAKKEAEKIAEDEEEARRNKLHEQGIVWQRKNLNDTGLTDNQQARVSKINNPERAARVQQRLVDRNTLTNQEVEQAVGTGAEITGKAIQGLGKAFGASQAASDSNLTKGIDSGVDAVGSSLSQMGGIAGGIGQILQIGSAAGQIIEGITGGTDQMTATDKFFDSGIGTVLGGWVNQLWGKNSDAFGIDQSMASTVGSSYGGSMDQLNEAARTADKKYGQFSSEARKKANEAISKAKQTQNLMSNVANTAADQRLAVQSMGEQAGLAYSMMTDGGYNQKYTYAAKHGGLLEWNPVIDLEWKPQVELNQELPTFKDGGSVEFVEELEWIPEVKEEEQYPKEYLKFKDSLPDYQKNTPESEYDTYLGWKLYGKPKDFEAAKELGMYSWDNSDESWHGHTIAWDETTGIGHFLKSKHHSTIGYELDWFNKGIVTEEGGKQREMTPEERKEWEEFKSNYELVDDGNFYKYIPKNKKGGSLGDSDIPETEETNQKNVIPEGALHKNKHHMEHADGLTKKGIPVVDEDGEQQAEIEHSEIIFTLEVTKKLEEYYEIFYSEESTNKQKQQAALDAGKLLVYQILENTEDRTGLIESCKKGGSLTLKKSTDDLIEEVLEWLPTVVIVETDEEPKKESKKEESEVSKKDTKDEIKEMIREVLIELLVK